MIAGDPTVYPKVVHIAALDVPDVDMNPAGFAGVT